MSAPEQPETVSGVSAEKAERVGRAVLYTAEGVGIFISAPGLGQIVGVYADRDAALIAYGIALQESGQVPSGVTLEDRVLTVTDLEGELRHQRRKISFRAGTDGPPQEQQHS